MANELRKDLDPGLIEEALDTAVKEEVGRLLSVLISGLLDPHETDKSQCEVRFRRGVTVLKAAYRIANQNV